jgi:hypothetical protein
MFRRLAPPLIFLQAELIDQSFFLLAGRVQDNETLYRGWAKHNTEKDLCVSERAKNI